VTKYKRSCRPAAPKRRKRAFVASPENLESRLVLSQANMSLPLAASAGFAAEEPGTRLSSSRPASDFINLANAGQLVQAPWEFPALSPQAAALQALAKQGYSPISPAPLSAARPVPNYVFMPNPGLAAEGVIQPLTSPGPTNSGYSPQQIRAAYGVDPINFGAIRGNGSGQTIALVEQGDNPNFLNTSDPNFAKSVLAVFDRTFGLPDPPAFRNTTNSATRSRQARTLAREWRSPWTWSGRTPWPLPPASPSWRISSIESISVT
jgi:hypothetical protein